MRLTTTTTGLRVTEFSWIWAVIGLPVAVASFWNLHLQISRGDLSGRTAIVGVAGLMAVIAVGFLTSWTEFRFEAGNQRIDWKRFSAFRRVVGVLGFEDVRYAAVQYMTTGTSRTSGAYRVVLATEEGLVPITTAYAVGRSADESCRKVRAAINAILGIRLDSEDAHDVVAMARDGNLAWAKRFAADRWGLNSTEADRYVRTLLEEGR